MKTRVFVGVITILTLLVGYWPAWSAVHTGSLILGLTTQPDTTGHFELVNYPPGPLRLYLMVYGYDHPQGIVAWDCALHLPRGVALERVELAGRGVNHSPHYGDFRVTTRTPLMPQNGMVLLATVDLRVLTDEDMGIDVGPDPMWGDCGFMGFARQTYETMREPMYHPRHCLACPVFMLTHTQADERVGWDHIKALYRP
ncbi:hypothetical protein CSB20_10010 [bacterium DOLZORAL124_64_63]|nr:MAG: hypothetical protein CSB20_10010 [bacterium DOLZORAL124_64_63]